MKGKIFFELVDGVRHIRVAGEKDGRMYALCGEKIKAEFVSATIPTVCSECVSLLKGIVNGG